MERSTHDRMAAMFLRAIGSMNFVATGFNPLLYNSANKSAIGTVHIKITELRITYMISCFNKTGIDKIISILVAALNR